MRRDTHHHKKDHLKHFKHTGMILLAALFVIAILFILVSIFGGDNFDFGLTTSKGKAPLSFSAEVALPSTTLNVDGVNLELFFEDSGGEFFLSDLGFNNLENTETRMENFVGVIMINQDGTVKLDGYSEKVFISNIDVNKQGQRLDIEVNDLKVESMSIYDLSLNSFSFISSGNLNTGEGGSLDLVGEAEFVFTPFMGDFEIFESKLKISGETDSLSVKGIPAPAETEE